ncbi:MAG TPA: IS630 family transposase [Gemmatimonadaceae bacterium]
MPSGPGAQRSFPPLQRARIERVACTEPAAYGLHLTRWDCRSLAAVVVEEAVVDSIHYTTVARLLKAASLQPHRSRYWKTAVVDEHFTRLAAPVLWCYERVEWLEQRGELVLCVDEKPNLQALERCHPTQPPRAGRIARHEFEYVRHGTVTFLVVLNVYEGTMWGTCLDANDSAHFLPAMEQALAQRRYRRAARIHLILDNGSSHIAHETRARLAAIPRLRVLYTPAHASWLDQAELLLRAFGDRYLDHLDVPSRIALITHLDASWPEYNRRYAHPFTWSWTRRDLHAWAAHRSTMICSQTSATVH